MKKWRKGSGSDPMMIKAAVKSPAWCEINHSPHHYRLFWSTLTGTERSFDKFGLEIFASR